MKNKVYIVYILCMALLALVFTACVPNWYRGSAAVLSESPSLKVIKRDRDWGDCYRPFGSMPTVYQLSRPTYNLHIAHGQRYWPELFLAAQAPDGTNLELRGPNVSRISHPRGGDVARLGKA